MELNTLRGQYNFPAVIAPPKALTWAFGSRQFFEPAKRDYWNETRTIIERLDFNFHQPSKVG
jgi:hypothetical protein